jgi:hypothetical protein
MQHPQPRLGPTGVGWSFVMDTAHIPTAPQTIVVLVPLTLLPSRCPALPCISTTFHGFGLREDPLHLLARRMGKPLVSLHFGCPGACAASDRRPSATRLS